MDKFSQKLLHSIIFIFFCSLIYCNLNLDCRNNRDMRHVQQHKKNMNHMERKLWKLTLIISRLENRASNLSSWDLNELLIDLNLAINCHLFSCANEFLSCTHGSLQIYLFLLYTFILPIFLYCTLMYHGYVMK